jgi:hypothetical protein
MAGSDVSGAYKRALVLAPFFNSDMNANRPLAAARALSEMAPVDVVTTDFDHWTKRKKNQVQVAPIDRIYYLKTLAYRKNTGFGRLLSHLLFSFRATMFFRKHRDRYDILYVTLPLNTLGWAALKCAGERWKLVDVTDIWPDVLPFPRGFVRLFRPVLGIWRKFFNRAVSKADVMMTVSDSFFKEASKFANVNCRTRRFYLSEVNLKADVPKEDTLTIAYSGNLGHLYDFETILEVLSEERGSVQLFIIGDGDRREWLLKELKRRGLPHRYFGSVYDQTKLADILPRAHLGFNGFVNTSAAFSTKASTYFAAGLPILNSMEGDLHRLVSEQELGLNYVGGDRASLKSCLAQLDLAKIKYMSQNCTRFFDAELERGKVCRDMLTFLNESLK